MSDTSEASDEQALATLPSSALVLYDPTAYQNRKIKPLPPGWTTASKSLTSFAPFPRLSQDLRYMIYDLLKPPRDVEIDVNVWYPLPQTSYVHGNGWLRRRVESDRAGALFSPTPRPITLSICQESRELTLRTYRCFFDFVMEPSSGVWLKTNEEKRQVQYERLDDYYKKNYIYINPSVDKVCFKTKCWKRDYKIVAEQIKPEEFSAIKKLTLVCPDNWMVQIARWGLLSNVGPRSTLNARDDPTSYCSLINTVKHFPKLRELHLDGHGVLCNVMLAIEELSIRRTWNLDPSDLRSAAQEFAKILLQRYQNDHPEWNMPSFTL